MTWIYFIDIELLDLNNKFQIQQVQRIRSSDVAVNDRFAAAAAAAGTVRLQCSWRAQPPRLHSLGHQHLRQPAERPPQRAAVHVAADRQAGGERVEALERERQRRPRQQRRHSRPPQGGQEHTELLVQAEDLARRGHQSAQGQAAGHFSNPGQQQFSGRVRPGSQGL